ncbi:MAG: hypothetical protein LBG69_06295 [Zoogloeaceae bacterium]|nr:hypothetical protein [Zoogloeaceae bacterium]
MTSRNVSLLWRKLAFAMLPFSLLVFLFFSISIIWSVLRGIEEDAARSVRGIVAINEEILNGAVTDVRNSVQTAADDFGRLSVEARHSLGEGIVRDMFRNRHIRSAWVVYEPDRFEETEARLPSRYIRAYTRRGTEVVRAGEVDDALMNPETSEWYNVPKRSRRLYSALNRAREKAGDARGVFVMSAPIVRDGVVVGAVGCESAGREIFLDTENNTGRFMSVLFSQDGRILETDAESLTKYSIQELGLSHVSEVEKAMREKRDFFFQDTFSVFFENEAVAYIRPASLQEWSGDPLFLYSALPSALARYGLSRTLRPVVIILLGMLCVLVLAFVFLVLFVSRPLENLFSVIENIGKEKISGRIPYLKRRDEIGRLARQLFGLQQYFAEQKRYFVQMREQLEIHLDISRLIYGSLCFEDALKQVLRVLRVRMGASVARLILLAGGQARLVAVSGMASDFYVSSFSSAPEFSGHEALSPWLEGRKYLSLSAVFLERCGLTPVAPKTSSLCILPMRVEDRLRFYVMLEFDREKHPAFSDDEILNFISRRLERLIARNEANSATRAEIVAQGTARMAFGGMAGKDSARRPAAVEKNENAGESEAGISSDELSIQESVNFLNAVRAIPGLEVDRALKMLSGNVDIYINMMPLAARELSFSLRKMADQVAARDMTAFAIEVHGCKGVLNNIGAFMLGEQAFVLENAAKSKDVDTCVRDYPALRASIQEFLDALLFAMPDRNAGKSEEAESARGTGNLEGLRATLTDARKAVEVYDLALATEKIDRAQSNDYVLPTGLDAQTVTEKLKEIAAFLDNIDYEGAGAAIDSLVSALAVGAENDSGNGA